jgi:signal transduction histidine kinase/ActR/RegA family two-component response regulator
MAEEVHGSSGEEVAGSSWRALWISGAALLSTLALIGLIVMITFSNSARDEALGWERRTYEVMLLTRTIDATIARSEAALGRYVLDENDGTGTAYYNEWRFAGAQIGQLQRLVRNDPDQRRRADLLLALYQKRGDELAPAATAAQRGEGQGGLGFLYSAARAETPRQLRQVLEQVARAERNNLSQRMAETRGFVARADAFTDWLGALAILIGLGAVGLAFMAWRAFRDVVKARGEAESEAWRALQLDQAVRERTLELSQANEALKAEAAERAAAEAQLRQVQKMEAVGRLTGGIAHDFNNMLAVVVGGLDLARRKLHGSRREVEFHLDSAMEGATRAAALTRRLLTFARAEPFLPEAIAPAELVENMLELVDRTIGERIIVHTRFPAEPWHIWADRTQLENAVLNLAVNARDAMEGSGELRIEVENAFLSEGEVEALKGGDYVRIAVADTGAGIAPENLERVFEPFFTTKEVGKGTGLGLSQIFAFAKESGGHVTIDSEVGRGTKVCIYLPRSQSAAEHAAERPPRPSSDSAPAERHLGAAILVVEDDPRVSRSTVAALEDLGYAPKACASGREAIELLERDPGVELIVTDVMMPEMTGIELAQIVSRRFPDKHLLFVTGYVGEAEEAQDLTGYDLLRKPFTVNALAAAVEQALGNRFNGLRLASTDEAAE